MGANNLEPSSTLPPIQQRSSHVIENQQLLSYERNLLDQLIDQDALVILATGLGWQKLVAVFIRLHQHQQPGAVLILGCQPWQRKLIDTELTRHHNAGPGLLGADLVLPIEVNSEVPAAERVGHYRSNACCYVTTRILVVDMLSGRVAPGQIAGMLVVNAHKVADISGEGFAVRLFRGGNSSGFLRAFSDQPAMFTTGFNKVEKVMRALRVRKLLLWPRFQEYVLQELEEHKPLVVQWDQELSEGMAAIQAAIVEVLQALITELKKTNKIDCSEMRLEECLHRSFDEAIRRQLDPVWNTVSWKTRQLVRDMGTVRSLATHLLATDAVTFLSYLEELRQTEGVKCVWLFHDATHAIYEQARRRVYVVKPAIDAAATHATSRKSKAGGPDPADPPDPSPSPEAVPAKGGRAAVSSSSGVQPVLEEAPKWTLLRKVLNEVQAERRELRALHPTDIPSAVAFLRAHAIRHDTGPYGQDGSQTDGGGSGGNGSGAGTRTGAVVVDLASSSSSSESGGSKGGGGQGVIDLASDSEDDVDSAADAAATAAATAAAPAVATASGGGERAGSSTGGAASAAAVGGGSGSGCGGDPAAMDAAAAALLSNGAKVESLRAAGRGRVLVVARELHMCAQLQAVLERGGPSIMKSLYEAYVLTKLGGTGSGKGGTTLASAAAGGGSATAARGSGGSAAGGGGGRGWGAGRHRGGGGGGRWGGGRGGRGSSVGGGGGGGSGGGGEVSGRGPLMRPGEQQALLAEAQRLGEERGVVQPAKKPRKGKVAAAVAAAEAAMAAAESAAAAVALPGSSSQGPPLATASAGGAPAAITTAVKARGAGKSKRRKKGAEDERAGDEQAGSDSDDLTMRKVRERSGGSSAVPQAEAGTGSRRGGDDSAQPKAGSWHGGGDVADEEAEEFVDEDPGEGSLLRDVVFHALDSHEEGVLWEVEPCWVILYDLDLAFVRQLEVYQAEHRTPAMVVHQLAYADSMETKKYMASVAREQRAFTNLIEFKSHVVVPLDSGPGSQVVPRGPGVSADLWLDLYGQNALTRVAGGRAPAAAKKPMRRLVVDVREFMSSLPAVLHQQGFELIPVTLEVGDYVLSPEMILERKAVPDLVQSLASGRLYHQAESMVRHYKTPILLIEFDPARSFSLQSSSDLGDDIDPRATMSRLVLLILHFPKMRLIWSRSPHASAEMFASLKSNQDEPDPAVATLVGVPGAIELLRQLPGVTETNYRTLMAAVPSLAALADTPLAQLEVILGSTKNAKVLREFLDVPCPRM
ncbi:MAG: hypothetical protein WDW36_007923 [Sanguina aurantia]